MDMRVLLSLLVVSICWCCEARDLTADLVSGKSDVVSVLPSSEMPSAGETQNVGKNEELCTLCGEFAAEALNYLSENKTQSEIINVLHKSCSKIPSFKQQCIVLVDYYAPLFFSEVSTIEAEDFCLKVGLCEQKVSFLNHVGKDKCDICHDAVTEAILKLKDPDTELEIVQLLLKACNSIGKTVKKCKRLVFEYAPIILVNAEEFLEKNDMCTILHACDSSAALNAETVIMGTESSMAASS